MRSKTSLSTQDLYSRCFASSNCLYYPRNFLSWCFLSCTRPHFGSCSCCSSAGSHTAFQHVSGLTVDFFFGTSTLMLLKSLVTSLRYNDRCAQDIVVKLHMSCCSSFSVVTKQNDPAAAVLPESWLCALYSSLHLVSPSPELALATGPCELAAGPCELAACPCRRSSTGTVGWEVEDVPGSCWGSSSSSHTVFIHRVVKFSSSLRTCS